MKFSKLNRKFGNGISVLFAEPPHQDAAHGFCRECLIPEQQKELNYFIGKGGTWRFPCSAILCCRCCFLRVFLVELLLAGFGTRNSIFVDVHDQEFVELDVLVSLQGSALVGPAQPLQVDAQTLGQLQGHGQERKIHIFMERNRW